LTTERLVISLAGGVKRMLLGYVECVTTVEKRRSLDYAKEHTKITALALANDPTPFLVCKGTACIRTAQ